MKVDDAFHGITTPITSTLPNAQSQGTGFFYQQLAPKDPDKEEQRRQIEQVWVVTNRHVLLPRIGENEVVPDRFSFHLRKIVDDKLVWDPIVLEKEQLLDRARFHPNPAVDICIVQVLDLLTDRIKSGDEYMPWYGVTREQLPGNNRISVEVADDAVVIGYPRGFYDELISTR